MPGFPGYEASSLGRVRSWHLAGRRKRPLDEPRLMTPHVKDGYLRIRAKMGDCSVVRGVHQFVARAFHGEPPPHQQDCRHLDGDKQNNTPTNLAWGTRWDNAQDRVAMGTHTHGDTHPSARLTSEQVATIRERRQQGWTWPAIASAFPHVSTRTIRDACERRTWGHVA